jgi:hypothetical protein
MGKKRSPPRKKPSSSSSSSSGRRNLVKRALLPSKRTYAIKRPFTNSLYHWAVPGFSKVNSKQLFLGFRLTRIYPAKVYRGGEGRSMTRIVDSRPAKSALAKSNALTVTTFLSSRSGVSVRQWLNPGNTKTPNFGSFTVGSDGNLHAEFQFTGPAPNNTASWCKTQIARFIGTLKRSPGGSGIGSTGRPVLKRLVGHEVLSFYVSLGTFKNYLLSVKPPDLRFAALGTYPKIPGKRFKAVDKPRLLHLKYGGTSLFLDNRGSGGNTLLWAGPSTRNEKEHRAGRFYLGRFLQKYLTAHPNEPRTSPSSSNAVRFTVPPRNITNKAALDKVDPKLFVRKSITPGKESYVKKCPNQPKVEYRLLSLIRKKKNKGSSSSASGISSGDRAFLRELKKNKNRDGFGGYIKGAASVGSETRDVMVYRSIPYYCSRKNAQYPGLLPNFTSSKLAWPCCWTKPRYNNKKDNLYHYLQSLNNNTTFNTDPAGAEAGEKNAILGDRSYPRSGRFAQVKVSSSMGKVLGMKPYVAGTHLGYFRAGVVRGPNALLHALFTASGNKAYGSKVGDNAKEKFVRNFRKTSLPKVFQRRAHVLTALHGGQLAPAFQNSPAKYIAYLKNPKKTLTHQLALDLCLRYFFKEFTVILVSMRSGGVICSPATSLKRNKVVVLLTYDAGNQPRLYELLTLAKYKKTGKAVSQLQYYGDAVYKMNRTWRGASAFRAAYKRSCVLSGSVSSSRKASPRSIRSVSEKKITRVGATSNGVVRRLKAGSKTLKPTGQIVVRGKAIGVTVQGRSGYIPVRPSTPSDLLRVRVILSNAMTSPASQASLLRSVARVRGLQNYAPRGMILDERKRVIAISVAAGRGLKAATKPSSKGVPGLPVARRGSYQVPVKYLFAGGKKVVAKDRRIPLVQSSRYYTEYQQRLFYDVGGFLKARPSLLKEVNNIKKASGGNRDKSIQISKLVKAKVYPNIMTNRSRVVVLPSLDQLPRLRTPCRLLKSGCKANPFCAVQNKRCYIRKLPPARMNKVHASLVHTILSSSKITGHQVLAHRLLRGGVQPNEVVLRGKREVKAFRDKYGKGSSSRSSRRQGRRSSGSRSSSSRKSNRT